MAKFKVLKIFKDIKTSEVYAIGQEIEMTDKRYKEVCENLNDTFLEEVVSETEAKEEVEPEKPKKTKKSK